MGGNADFREINGLSVHTVGRATLTLAIVAVVVAGEEGSFNVDGIGDGFAETVSGERHAGRCYRVVLDLMNW